MQKDPGNTGFVFLSVRPCLQAIFLHSSHSPSTYWPATVQRKNCRDHATRQHTSRPCDENEIPFLNFVNASLQVGAANLGFRLDFRVQQTSSIVGAQLMKHNEALGYLSATRIHMICWRTCSRQSWSIQPETTQNAPVNHELLFCCSLPNAARNRGGFGSPSPAAHDLTLETGELAPLGLAGT